MARADFFDTPPTVGLRVFPRAGPIAEAASEVARVAHGKGPEMVMQGTHALADAARRGEHGLRRLATKVVLAVEEKVQTILFDENAKAVARMARRRAEEDRRRGR